MSGRNRGIANASKNKIIWTALAILLLSTALLLLSPGSTTGDFFSLWPVAVLLLAAVVALIGEDSRIANAYNTALFLIACNLALGVVLVPAFLS